MNFFRTDSQAALNSLIKAARETMDHYDDATTLVKQNDIPALDYAQLFSDIATQRQDFISHLEDAIRAIGDLPAAPDADKEAGAMLIHHVAAMLKNNYAADIILQRITAEENLTNLIAEAKTVEPNAPYTTLLNEFSQHIAETLTRLRAVHQQLMANQN